MSKRKYNHCQICSGTRGGIPGNNNVINGIAVCDYCHADILNGKPLVIVIDKASSGEYKI